jgi:hypothetical protein
MLTRMAMTCDAVAEADGGNRANSDYEHEHRFAEHEAGTEPDLRVLWLILFVFFRTQRAATVTRLSGYQPSSARA